MHKKYLAIVLLAMILGGCQDFKKEHPDFPKWGWWDKKEIPTTQPTTPSASSQDTSTAASPGLESPALELSAPPATSKPPAETPPAPVAKAPPSEPTKVQPVSIPQPSNHRSEVWQYVSKLRDLGNYPAEEQKKMIDYAQENVQQWYKPLSVTSPDMNKADWVIVMVWDFMPPADFQKAAANWKQIAETEKVQFPTNLTRRKLMKFVRKMQDRKP